MEKREQVVESLYRILSDAGHFEDFIGKLAGRFDTLVGELQDEDASNPDRASRHFDDIEQHFRRVASVFARFRLDTGASPGATEPDESPLPRLELGASGQILRANEAGRALFPVGDTDNARAIIEPGATQILTATLRQIVVGRSEGLFAFLPAYTRGRNERVILMLTPADSLARPDAVAILQGVDFVWRPDIGEAMSRTFVLTPSETEIMQAIVSGEALSDLAARRQRSLATVRTQAKSLLRKCEVRSQLELVRLFSAMSMARPARDARSLHGNRRTFMMKREGGRLVQVDVYGPEDGRPFLFVHGFVTGTGMTAEAVDLLHAANLRMIAPWRPGFAGSTAAGAAFDSVPDIVTADLHQVLRHFGLRRVPFVGRDAGIIYAAAAAAAPGDAASAVVAVSGMVPTRDRRQLDHIALWQRMFAYAARYFPAALPILARGAMELVSTGKLDRLLDGLYQTPAIDHRLVAVPEIRDILRESFVSTFAHGTRACEVDARRTALDWTALALSGLRVPLVYVHGALDPVSVPRQVDDLAHRTPGMSIETIADGGQLIWYSHPRTIFEVIARHAGQQDQT